MKSRMELGQQMWSSSSVLISTGYMVELSMGKNIKEHHQWVSIQIDLCLKILRQADTKSQDY